MTPALRRLLLAIAAFVFFILTTIVLALAAGYDLDGWRIVRRAGIIVDSRPKAQVILNGQAVGTTPYRSSRLEPGAINITLQRTGFEPWSTTVNVATGTSTPVSVVRLFPIVKPAAISVINDNDSVIHDTGSNAVWIVRSDETTATATGYGPTTWPVLSFPFRPTRMLSAMNGNAIYADDGLQASITQRDGRIWVVSPVNNPRWLENGSVILVGERDGLLRSLDPLDQSLTIGTAVESFTVREGAIWSTTRSAGRTTLWRQETLVANRTAAVTIDGDWTIQPDTSNQLILRALLDNQTRRVTGNRVTGWSTVTIDDAQRVLSVSGSPLTWTDGLDVRIQLQRDRSVLLDRFPRGVRWAGWYHVATTVVVTDGTDVNVYGRYSTRPFQRMYSTPLPTGSVYLGPLPRGEGFWFTSGDQLYSWSWRS